MIAWAGLEAGVTDYIKQSMVDWAGISGCQNLFMLTLQQNELKRLPEEFTDLKNLTSLYLNNNKLESLPERIGNMNLSEVYIYHNKLFELPKSFGNLSDLVHIRFDNTYISEFPP